MTEGRDMRCKKLRSLQGQKTKQTEIDRCIRVSSARVSFLYSELLYELFIKYLYNKQTATAGHYVSHLQMT